MIYSQEISVVFYLFYSPSLSLSILCSNIINPSTWCTFAARLMGCSSSSGRECSGCSPFLCSYSAFTGLPWTWSKPGHISTVGTHRDREEHSGSA